VDRRQIALKLTFEVLGVPIDLDTFNGRLIVQKAAYLAQAQGINLGYHFSWYLRGPYCSSLTEDAFSLESSESIDNWRLDEASKDKLDAIRDIFTVDESEKDTDKLARHLELLASVNFLVRKREMAEDAEKIKETLERYNKIFSVAEVEDAFKTLASYHFA
jgi:uncharacterized protein YwgA